MALLVQRLVERTYHLLIAARCRRHLGQLLRHGLAGDGLALAMQQSGLEQQLEHLRHATGAMEIGRDKTARGLEIAQHRHTPAHALEIIDGPAHTGGRGNRQKVQHGIGGAAGGHDQRHGILD